MKFTILPDMEAKKKNRDTRSEKRRERRARHAEKNNRRYLKRRRFWPMFAVRFLILFVICGALGTMYVGISYETVSNDIINEIDATQETVSTQLFKYYQDLVEAGVSAEEARKMLSRYASACLPAEKNYFYSEIPGGHTRRNMYEGAKILGTTDGEIFNTSEPAVYLWEDVKIYPNEDKPNKWEYEIANHIYEARTELPEDFLNRYEDYKIWAYSGAEGNMGVEFENFYLDEDGDGFYFGKVTFYNNEKIIATYDFTPDDTSDLRRVEDRSSLTELYDGSAREYVYNPVIQTGSSQKLLACAEQTYRENYPDQELGGAETLERGRFEFTVTKYSRIGQAQDGFEFILVTAYRYDFLQEYKNIVTRTALFAWILAAAVSFLWSRHLYVRLRARYAMEDYQRTLTNAMAHDLKSPLMVLSGLAENLKENVHTEKREYYTDAMLTNIADMNHMIEQTLDFSRLQAENKTIKRDMVDMGKLTGAALRKYRSVYEEKQMNVSVNGSCVIRGNEALLTQAAENLLQNAVLHGTEGSVVKINMEQNVYAVTNDYPGGLTTKDAKRLTEAYQKDESRKNTGGHGLGLAIVSEIVRQHRGRLTFAIDDKTFTVRMEF